MAWVLLFTLVLGTRIPLVHAFSIGQYYSEATVLENGDLAIYERITFNLERTYREGFRSIRWEDYEGQSNVEVHSVQVNGRAVPWEATFDSNHAEIIWKRTYPGSNVVELNYTLKNRVTVYDDFAKVCFEHLGANWEVPVQRFQSVMRLPEKSRGKDMHFEIYSAKRGTAHVDDLAVVVEMDDVPPGNYIGGCYLYDRSATTSQRHVGGSAYDLLQDERRAYRSESILEPASAVPAALLCAPVLVLVTAIAAYWYSRDRRLLRYSENLLPPDSEEPSVVSVLVRNAYAEKELLAATIVDLINRGILDIVELEKAGETSGEVKRERTILMLKRKASGRPDLKPYENAVVDMIFGKKRDRKEVDLDAMARELDAVQSKTDAQKLPVVQSMEEFSREIEGMLKGKGIWDIRNGYSEKRNGALILVLFLMAVAVFWMPDLLSGSLGFYMAVQNIVDQVVEATAVLGMGGLVAYGMGRYLRPSAPIELREEQARWDAFARAVKASRLKEYPPSSAVIWGRILVYATALGIADKVKRHLSELDSFVLKRIDRLERVQPSAYVFYQSAWGLQNLSRYGSRQGGPGNQWRGMGSGHGGFSAGSSGGWSSFGGGGFSGGSSGGGGFR